MRSCFLVPLFLCFPFFWLHLKAASEACALAFSHPIVPFLLCAYTDMQMYLVLCICGRCTGPVIKGIKWNAVKWIHGEPFRGDEYAKSLTQKAKPPPDPADCTDLHPLCDTWANAGECTKNADYVSVLCGTGVGAAVIRVSWGGLVLVSCVWVWCECSSNHASVLTARELSKKVSARACSQFFLPAASRQG